MARFLSLQTLISRRIFSSTTLSPRLLSHAHRSKSNRSGEVQFIEVDLDSSSSATAAASSTSDADAINGGIRKLEEAIHTIIVKRSAPDWLPFLPGYSYWVPPRHLTMRHPHGIVEVVRKISASGRDRHSFSSFSDEETMSFASSRGWPSSNYFIEGNNLTYALPMEVEVKIHENSEKASDSSDEEG